MNRIAVLPAGIGISVFVVGFFKMIDIVTIDVRYIFTISISSLFLIIASLFKMIYEYLLVTDIVKAKKLSIERLIKISEYVSIGFVGVSLVMLPNIDLGFSNKTLITISDGIAFMGLGLTIVLITLYGLIEQLKLIKSECSLPEYIDKY